MLQSTKAQGVPSAQGFPYTQQIRLVFWVVRMSSKDVQIYKQELEETAEKSLAISAMLDKQHIKSDQSAKINHFHT